MRLSLLMKNVIRCLTNIDPLIDMLAAGDIVPAIGQRASLVETATAIRAFDAGQGHGKTVITVGTDAQ